jgi:hypothetical protein
LRRVLKNGRKYVMVCGRKIKPMKEADLLGDKVRGGAEEVEVSARQRNRHASRKSAST